MNAYAVPGVIRIKKDLELCLMEAGINISDYTINSRKREICERRQAIMAFANIELDYIQEEAGKLFNKDRCTALFASSKIRDELDIMKIRPNMKITNRLQLYLKLVEIKNNKTL